MNGTTIEGFRLSPQQRRLWLLHQSERAPSYRTLCAVVIQGALDVHLLERALRALVGRNEILRTAFQHLPGTAVPAQVVRDDIPVSFQEHNFQGLETDGASARVESLADELIRRPADPERGPHWHAAVASLSPRRHVLLLAASAICLDARSLRNVARELSRGYAAMLGGGEVTDEPMQFADLAEWQNEMVESEEAQVGVEYWRTQLPAALADVRLPFEGRAGGHPFDPRKIDAAVQPELLAKLRMAAGAHNVSISTFLLACWQVLCWRLATEPDEVAVGVAYDGRKHEDLEGALGPFEKYLPLPCRARADMPFGEFVRQVHGAEREADEWQECFDWGQLAQRRETGPSVPFIPLCFSFEEQPPGWEAADLLFSIDRTCSCSERFKLKLGCVIRDGRLLTEFHYDSGLLLRDDVERLAEQFHTLLGSAAGDPAAALGRLNILSEGERRRLLVELNRTGADSSDARAFHELWEDVVERVPDDIAVVYGERRLSYAELNSLSNKLARQLRSMGVGPETLVAICAERSPEMVIAALGVLKAGGAYVPLDPGLPSERLQFMLDDTRAAVLLTQERLAEGLPRAGAKIIKLDADWDLIARHSPDNLGVGLHPDNLAYVIYTSGSTGRPKGVMVSHGGFVNYLKWAVSSYRVAGGDGAPVHSPFTFDLTVTSLFCPLLAGRKAVLLAEEQGIDALANALEGGGDFSLVKITPAHLEILSQQLRGKGVISKIGALVIGGEALSGESLAFWSARAPGTRLINEYGPTESVVGSCVYELPPTASLTGPVPIGRPIANTQVYILDARMQPVPVGVPGELYLGGVGLARGYLGRPGLTAERFVPHPFSAEPGGRLYRTGDSVRYLPDGQIDFLGRVDQQVKLRGYRIELGEVEAVLGEHPLVREAVVALREDGTGERRLVAYVVGGGAGAAGDGESTGEALSRYLRGRLPAYMVPSAFVTLERLPLTPNGKIDRRALPAPKRGASGRQFVAPRSPLEEGLAEIWREVLGAERVGVFDNFFELGGHSLLATQVCSRVRNVFGVEMPVQRIFEFPTISELATVLVQEQCRHEDAEEAGRLLLELEKLSGDEAQALLAGESHPAG